MKKYIATLVLALVCASAYATQGISITMGYAQPTLREGLYKSDSPTMSNYRSDQSKNIKLKGGKFGVMYDADIVAGFGAAVGLNYTFGVDMTKWTKRNSTYSQEVCTVSSFHTAEIVVDWQYKFEIAQKTYLILYTGPTISFDFGAKSKFYTRVNEEAKSKYEGSFNWQSGAIQWETEEIKAQNKEANANMPKLAIQSYNVLWGVGAGFQYKRYFIRGGYDFGLINAYKNDTFEKSSDSTVQIRSRLDQWQVKLGIYLWQKQKKI